MKIKRPRPSPPIGKKSGTGKQKQPSEPTLLDEDGLPSDQALAQFISDCPEPPKLKEIARAFGIRADGRAGLRKRLRVMAERGLIDTAGNRRLSSSDRLPAVAVVEVTAIDSNGDGIAVASERHHTSEKKASSIILRHDRRRGRAFAVGRRVLAKLEQKSPNRYEGRVIRMLEPTQRHVFGEVVPFRDGKGVIPAQRGKPRTLPLAEYPSSKTGRIQVKIGDLIEAEVQGGSGYRKATATALRNLGPARESGAFSALALAELGIPVVFPEAAISEAEKAKPPALDSRKDLRTLPLVTIDGADARDFDDAVFAESLQLDDGRPGFRLVVAIADVAHFVRPGSALDNEAQRRGNSVYLPDRVVPMLPEALSNGLCSLKPGEDRACLAAEIWIDSAGNKQRHRFHRGLMRSQARLTYDAAEAWRMGDASHLPENVEPKWLEALFAAYEALAIARQDRQALELTLPERRVILDDDGHAIAIEETLQNTSQKLIEEFMILANVAAAETLESAHQTAVYRGHEPPDPAKLEALRDLVETMALALPKGQRPRPAQFNSMLEKLRQRDDPAAMVMLSEAILRSQSQAKYTIRNPGHFGLALQRYVHFTSPIRRYADLMVHRGLIAGLGLGDGGMGYDAGDAEEIATAISETERRATAAERQTADRFAASLLCDSRGTTRKGIITTVAGFGAFIRLEGAGDGLLPLSNLPDDYYHADTIGGRIEGSDHGLLLSVGDELEVLVLEADPLRGSVLLGFISGGSKTTGRRGKSRHKKPGKTPRKTRRTHR